VEVVRGDDPDPATRREMGAADRDRAATDAPRAHPAIPMSPNKTAVLEDGTSGWRKADDGFLLP
jgi:hypothetical protein